MRSNRLLSMKLPIKPSAAPDSRQGQKVERSFNSAELFAGSTEIEIVHEQAVYLLKITRQGKLILNK